MIIKKKRIRSIKKYLLHLKTGQKFYLGVSNYPRFKDILSKIGFSNSLKKGETVLPSGKMGPISLFNSIGKYIKLTSKPMETAYRTNEWHWKDWGGGDHYKLVDVPYKRYPREFIKPPAIELQIKDNFLITIEKPLTINKNEFDNIKHIMNLFLELFGECQVFDDNLSSFAFVPVKKLNWEILPEGEYPWSKLKNEVKNVLDDVKSGNKPVVENRLEVMSSLNPDFVAVGKAGFNGYLVYGFKSKGLFILESAFYGNATYVFEKNWQTISQLTKAEIIENDLHKERIIHNKDWENEINKIFGIHNELFNQSK